MNAFPTISVIINTDGRAAILANCLNSLRYLRYPNFEVVVVAGPTRDGTHELCASYGKSIKFADCPERNLSMSRNISIQISAGELVAFLDDDSVPEPEWLDDVAPAFSDPDVAVAGGFLHDHTGKTYQWRFGTLNRFGAADTSWERAAPEYNFPNSFNYPHVMANSLFRRSAIVEVGGFDEEYEYFLDESDIILRFVDNGWKVAQLDKGFVHHKFMPSHIRNESRVLTGWYSVIKNKAYFSLQHARGHASVDEILDVVKKQVEEFRSHVAWAVNEKLLPIADLDRYEREAERAWHDGTTRGLNGKRKLVIADSLKGSKVFSIFDPILPAAKQSCFVFLSRTFPPGSVGGIGRFVHHLARAIAGRGHQVHVLTMGEGHDRVDFEEGVWVHRICIRDYPAPVDVDIPPHIWNYSRTMYAEAEYIAERRAIELVSAPIWDIEGIAFLIGARFPLVTSLQTTLHFYLDTNPDKKNDTVFMDSFVHPMLALERRMMQESNGVFAISKAIVEEIEAAYQFSFNPATLYHAPLGLADWCSLPTIKPDALPNGALRICFIGRLESRKGIDVLLSVLPELIDKYPNIYFDIVGNHKIISTGDKTFREVFEAEHKGFVDNPRLVFHGEVDEERLRGFYQAADILLAPSRFESFGLVHLEGMMYGKPVIGCNIGGMQEVIQNGKTGLLAQPGDATSLKANIQRLIEDKEFRLNLGKSARKSYLDKFTAEHMADGVIRAFEHLAKDAHR